MQHIYHRIFSRYLCITLACLALFGYSIESPAWARDGHSAIGIVAVSQLSAEVKGQLEKIFAPMDEQTITKACSWPDTVRDTEEWEWSGPLHYVNIPRGDFNYRESRDCPEQLCVTGGIKRYAAELANPELGLLERQQAFAWLCHLVGDLHQPLHAGFADDRGGNDFEVMTRDERMSLHRYWDHELINQHSSDLGNLVEQLQAIPLAPTASDWSESSVNEWTDESHQLARENAYPASQSVDSGYEQQSWELAHQQLRKAAARLALIINSVLPRDRVQPGNR